jgi:hypothetical protein
VSAAIIITRLMRELEDLRAENDDLREELHQQRAPANPFPLVAPADILRILHPVVESPAIRPASRDGDGTAKRRAIAAMTHRLIRAGKSGMEIRDAIITAAEEFDIASKSALTIAGNILTESMRRG